VAGGGEDAGAVGRERYAALLAGHFFGNADAKRALALSDGERLFEWDEDLLGPEPLDGRNFHAARR
jgi:hypothetical protein